VGRDRVLDGGGLNNLGSEGWTNKGMVDVAPSAFGRMTRAAESDAAETDGGLLAGPSLTLLDRHIEITDDQLVTWVGNQYLV
jgi:hypothetical protein